MKPYAVLVVAAVATLFAACGGKTADVADDDAPGSGGGGGESILKFVPDRPEFRSYVTITNLDAVFKEIGADRDDYVKALAGTFKPGYQVPAPLVSNNAAAEALRNLETIRIDPQTFEQSLHAGQPPRMIAVVRGEFDAEAIVAAAKDCRECSVQAREHSYRDVTYLSWSDDPLKFDPQRRLAPPLFDELGRAPFLAVGETFLLKAYAREDLEAMIDAWKDGTSLADGDFGEVLGALEKEGSLNSFLSDETQEAEEAGPLLLEPYGIIGLGQAPAGSTVKLVAVLQHASERAAGENEKVVPGRFAEVESLAAKMTYEKLYGKPVTRVEKDLLVVTMDGPAAKSFHAFFFRRDPLFGHRPR